MIRPKIVPLTAEYQAGVDALVLESNHPEAVGWTYPPDLSLIALHNGRVVGLLTAWADQRPYAWLDAMLVHPDVRNQGIAYFLYLAMKRLLKARGIKKLWAFTTYEGWVEKADRLGLREAARVALLEGDL